GATTGGPYLVPALRSGITEFSGTYVLKQASNQTAAATPTGYTPVELNSYHWVKFAVRTNGAATSAIDFKIHNVSDPSIPDNWFAFTLGSSDWTTTHQQRYLAGTINGQWAFYSDDLWYR